METEVILGSKKLIEAVDHYSVAASDFLGLDR